MAIDIDEDAPRAMVWCKRSAIDAVRSLARLHGYAVGVHGSLARDVDLIAVPWIEHPSTPEELILSVTWLLGHRTPDKPTYRPHGRVAYTVLPKWSWQEGPPWWIDLSIIAPR